MECLAGLSKPASSAIMRQSLLTCTFKKKYRNGVFRAKVNDDEDDPLFESAIYRASLRFQETLRPEPLFVDLYAGCFMPPNIQMDMKHHMNHYCLATKFIDDKLLHSMNNVDGLKQVVLLTDGMDTRPYRLRWPTSTIIFDISPERVFRRSAQKLEDVGAKVPRSCLLLHEPMESANINRTLRSKGFNGNRPSIWAFQGLPMTSLANFEDILMTVSSLAMKGCLLLGELPACLAAETEVGVESSTKEWMYKVFMSHGFEVDVIDCKEVAKDMGKEPELQDYKNILFVAEHLRFSDDQMEIWRREFQRMEDEGDEEGFEEL